MEDVAGPADAELAQFVAITNCQPDQAAFYIAAADGNFEQAIAMYYGAYVVLLFAFGASKRTSDRPMSPCVA